ncbi:ribose-5-phosphate isomerase RpiA [Maritalea mobilis]|uniref:ribose-5-phosphate isomerase RpiA n=1 Tax=Maritalea mobilis TaxID=483324 RepID=UPI001061B891|nr:ribose-5-phosphate isomerase RpiA [Maritalea mobilis]
MLSDELKKQAALAAMSEVKSGMRIGLGTGSTAKHFVDYLGAEVAKGFECLCVPTSIATMKQAQSLNIPLTTLDEIDRLDVTVDGADEIDDRMQLIKGGGGALLREKIVAAASDKMVVIADTSKLVEVLGKFALPIEVNKFGLGATQNAVSAIMQDFKAEGGLVLRQQNDAPFVTDGGHFILDASFGRISDAKALSDELLNVPGVVQHGLFLGLCAKAYLADANGVKELG